MMSLYLVCFTSKQFGELHKIGITSNPNTRLKVIQNKWIVNREERDSFRILAITQTEHARRIEAELHERYSMFNFRFPQIVKGREWFILNDLQVKDVIATFNSVHVTENELQESTNSIDFPGRVRSDTFIPYVGGQWQLTPEQLDRLFPIERRVRFLRELADLQRR